MAALLQDLRFAWRTFRGAPGHTVAALLCLALGVGLNTTVFSLVQGLMLRPLPFAEPESLVAVRWARLHFQHDDDRLSYLSFRDLGELAGGFSALAAYDGRSLALGGSSPVHLNGEVVSASLFPLLGVHAAHGRVFLPEEDRPGAPRVMLLSDGLWHRRFQGDARWIGASVVVDGLPTTIVGVMPPEFAFPKRTEAWLPLAPAVSTSPRDARSLDVLARLRPGWSLARVRGDVAAVSAHLSSLYPQSDAGWGGIVRPVREELVSADTRQAVLALMGAVVSVLLIACANVANLQLTRAAGRQREIAVRTALGAPRRRLIAQLLTEAVVLALVGGVLGLGIAIVGIRLIVAAIPRDHAPAYWMHFDLDGGVLLFTLVAAVVAGILAGLAPAITGAQTELNGALKDGGRGSGARRGTRRLREGLVVAEVALAMMLLVAAALFARSFLKISVAGAGFEAAAVLSLRVELPGPAFGEDAARVRGVHEMLRRIESVPGVTAATASGLTPLEEGGNGAQVAIEGRTTRHGEEPGVFYAGVTPGFFRTLGAPLRAGRELTPEESDSGARFAVINETFANRFWPDVPALGKRFRLQQFPAGDWFTVVGVVADFQNEEVRSPVKPSAYIAFGLDAGRNVGFLVKASGPPALLAEPLRRAIHSAVPEAPVFGVLPMSEVVTANVWSDRLLGQLFGVFGAVAVLLAAVGVYGVLAYSVRQRRQEIGVRMALGADDRDVLRLVVGNGLGLAAVGIAGGLLGAFAATRVVGSMLYNVSPTDPASFVLVPLFLVAVALAASYLPARAALAAQPVEAFRHE